MESGLVAGVIGLGIVHGVLPDHGWPIAATYALQFDRKWLRGTIAALILGIGHLISSVALVGAYFWIAAVAEFAESPWMGYVAGTVLIALGVYTYVSGGHGDHAHGHHGDHADHHGDHADHHGDHADHHGDHADRLDHGGHGAHDPDRGHGHVHADTDHDGDGDADETEPGHACEGGRDHGRRDGHVDDQRVRPSHDGHHDAGPGHHDGSLLSRIRGALPGGGHGHLSAEHARDGLFTLGTTALLLGFAHEEPIQILAICAGTEFCLELMLVYSLAVIGAILAPTLALVMGYERHRERIERYTPYLPALTAAVLVLMGLGFVTGLL